MTLSPAPYAGGVTEAAPFSSAELEHIRAQFPILRRDLYGHPLVYLDSAATAQKPTRVIEAEATFYREANAAVHRGAHTLAGEATELYEDARGTVARFLAVNDDEVIFTSNATEGLNLIAYAIGNASLGRGGAAAAPYALRDGDEIVVTELEHHANLIPWQELAARTGATLRFIPVDDSGAIDVDAATGVIGARTRILAVSHVSNVTGAHSPLDRLVPLARAVGALVVLDACQSAPHLPLRPRELDVDAAVFSGHKLYGPTGIGVLWGRYDLLEAMPPYQGGGSMIDRVTFARTSYAPPPGRFEAGTPHIVGVVGLHAAIDYVDGIGLERIHAHEAALVAQAREALSQLNSVRLFGPADSAGIVSFAVEGVHPHDVATILDEGNVAIRAGHHCAQPLMDALGVPATARASFGVYNGADDIAALVKGIERVTRIFG